MSDVTGDVLNKSRSGAPEHSRHDRLLIARHVAGDTGAVGAAPAEFAEASSLIERCRDCANLAADLRALVKAARELPAPVRPRDFRISEQQAVALRSGAFERLARRLAAPRLGYLRPLAAATMSIGLLLAAIGWQPQIVPMPVAGTGTEAAQDRIAALPSDAAALGGTTIPRQAVESKSPDAPTAGGAGGHGPWPAASGPSATNSDSSFGQLDSEGYNPYLEPRARGDEAAALSAQPDPLRALLMIAGLGLAVAGLSALTLVTLGRRRLDDPLLR